MNFEKLIKELKSGRSDQPGYLLRSQSPLVFKMLRHLLRQQSFEIVSVDFAKKGPNQEFLDQLSAGGGLFAEKKCFFVSGVAPLSKWSKKSKDLWAQCLKLIDPNLQKVILFVSSDKRVKWTSIGLNEVTLSFEARDIKLWLEAYGKMFQLKLDHNKIEYLSLLDEPIEQLANYMELWDLGGDVWAKNSIAWGDAGAARLKMQSSNSRGGASSNPAFQWVDSVLLGNKKQMIGQYRQLIGTGQEPFMLMALLAKSVRIAASIEANQSVVGQADFLVKQIRFKMQSFKRTYPKQRFYYRKLLDKLAYLDVKMKSSPLNKEIGFESLI